MSAFTAPASAEPGPSSAPAAAAPLGELDYAASLMAEEDWYRAISVLKRHRFLGGVGGADALAGIDLLIGACYQRGGQHFDAYRVFGKVLDAPGVPAGLRAEAAWRRVQAAHLGGATLLVNKDAPRLLPELAGTPFAAPVAYVHGFSLLNHGRWDDAAAAFRAAASADPAGETGRNASELHDLLAQSPRYHPKSPALAGALAVVPGLGHVYAERYGDAWNALLPSAVLLTSTGLLASSAREGDVSAVWPVVVGVVAAAFYAANIYSAVNVVRQGNQLIVSNEVAWYRERSVLPRLEAVADPLPAGGAPR